jgi:ketosteroid isomerase-like protein
MVLGGLIAALLTMGALAGHHESKVVIGLQHFGDGNTKPLYGGNQANLAIWSDYIQAHNDRDFDKIAAMNAPNFKGVAAHGEVIRGSEAHSAFLKTWIETQQTTWKIWWVIANDGENEDGEMEEWLATGTLVTTTNPDGTEVTSYETIDVLLENGKVRLLNVASQQMPE